MCSRWLGRRRREIECMHASVQHDRIRTAKAIARQRECATMVPTVGLGRRRTGRSRAHEYALAVAVTLATLVAPSHTASQALPSPPAPGSLLEVSTGYELRYACDVCRRAVAYWSALPNRTEGTDLPTQGLCGSERAAAPPQKRARRCVVYDRGQCMAFDDETPVADHATGLRSTAACPV